MRTSRGESVEDGKEVGAKDERMGERSSNATRPLALKILPLVPFTPTLWSCSFPPLLILVVSRHPGLAIAALSLEIENTHRSMPATIA